MASALDVGDADNLHPKNKADVGERLALWALRDVYGQPNLVASGPLLRDFKIEGTVIRLSFDEIGGGLMVAHKDGRAPRRRNCGRAFETIRHRGRRQKMGLGRGQNRRRNRRGFVARSLESSRGALRVQHQSGGRQSV